MRIKAETHISEDLKQWDKRNPKPRKFPKKSQ